MAMEPGRSHRLRIKAWTRYTCLPRAPGAWPPSDPTTTQLAPGVTSSSPPSPRGSLLSCDLLLQDTFPA